MSLLLLSILGLLALISLMSPSLANNPHSHLTWQLITFPGDKKLATWKETGRPSFDVRPFDFIPGTTCRDGYHVYLCPSETGSQPCCASPSVFYCPYWGCETLASGWTPTLRDSHLSIAWHWHQGTRDTLCITVLDPQDSGLPSRS